MNKALEILKYVLDNWETLLPILLAIYEVIASAKPTEKNLSLIDNVVKLLRFILPNRRKPQPTDIVTDEKNFDNLPVSDLPPGVKGKLKNRVLVNVLRHIIPVILVFFCVTASAQTNGRFKSIALYNADSLTVRTETTGLVNTFDSVFVMYLNEQSSPAKLRCFTVERGWYDCPTTNAGGGGGTGNVTGTFVSPRVPYANGTHSLTDESGFEYSTSDNELQVDNIRMNNGIVNSDSVYFTVSDGLNTSSILLGKTEQTVSTNDTKVKVLPSDVWISRTTGAKDSAYVGLGNTAAYGTNGIHLATVHGTQNTTDIVMEDNGTTGQIAVTAYDTVSQVTAGISLQPTSSVEISKSEASTYTIFRVGTGSVNVDTNVPASPGIVGTQDYSANLTSLSYPQKVYTDATYVPKTLTSGRFIVGNASNVATAVPMSGDIALANNGGTTYAGTVPVNKGGTGFTTIAANEFVYGTGTNVIGKLPAGTGSQVLRCSGGVPGWGLVTVQGGGTNFSSIAIGDLIYGNGVNSMGKLTIGSTNQVLEVIGGLPSWQTKNITGMISAGTNVSITGTGTVASPYVINSSGGGGGITNSAGLNEIPKTIVASSNIGSSSLYAGASAGDFVLGKSGTTSGVTRRLTATGSSSSISLLLSGKGAAGSVVAYGNTFEARDSAATSRVISISPTSNLLSFDDDATGIVEVHDSDTPRDLNLRASDPSTAGTHDGGSVNINGGNSGTTAGNAGNVNITGGTATSSGGAAGNVTISSGDATSGGSAGIVTITGGDGQYVPSISVNNNLIELTNTDGGSNTNSIVMDANNGSVTINTNSNDGNLTVGRAGGGNFIIFVLPTSCSGAPTGALWNDSGTLKICP